MVEIGNCRHAAGQRLPAEFVPAAGPWTPPRRIPPPPTRFAAASGQPKAETSPGRGVFAPPPTCFAPASSQPKDAVGRSRDVFAPPPGRFPAEAAQRKSAAPVPPTLHAARAWPGQGATAQRHRAPSARHADGVIQRAEVKVVPQKPIVECTMGQGVNGSLNLVVLHSRRFSTCVPIVMFNEYADLGGFFHFAAGNMGAQKSALRALFLNVMPTEIHIGTRAVDKSIGGAFDRVQTETDGDPENIRNYLKSWGFSGTFRTLGRAEQYYVTLDSANKLAITVDLPKGTGELIDYTYTTKPDIPKSAEEAMATVSLFGKNLYSDGKPV